METEQCLGHLRNAVLSSFRLSEKSFKLFSGIFQIKDLKSDDFFCNSGDYPGKFAFICNGIIRSFYINSKKQEIVNGFYYDHSFILPVPPFIYRKPLYLNYQAVTDAIILQARFSDLESLMNTHPDLKVFIRDLTDREWIIRRELYESGIHIYNSHTRFRIFMDVYSDIVSRLSETDVASYLKISKQQLKKFLENEI